VSHESNSHRRKFNEHQLVFTGGLWYAVSSCIWTNRILDVGPEVGQIGPACPELEKFFVKRLGVKIASDTTALPPISWILESDDDKRDDGVHKKYKTHVSWIPKSSEIETPKPKDLSSLQSEPNPARKTRIEDPKSGEDVDKTKTKVERYIAIRLPPSPGTSQQRLRKLIPMVTHSTTSASSEQSTRRPAPSDDGSASTSLVKESSNVDLTQHKEHKFVEGKKSTEPGTQQLNPNSSFRFRQRSPVSWQRVELSSPSHSRAPSASSERAIPSSPLLQNLSLASDVSEPSSSPSTGSNGCTDLTVRPVVGDGGI
jgi:hypothetical protein